MRCACTDDEYIQYALPVNWPHIIRIISHIYFFQEEFFDYRIFLISLAVSILALSELQRSDWFLKQKHNTCFECVKNIFVMIQWYTGYSGKELNYGIKNFRKKKYVGLSIILDTIIKKFDRRKPFEGTHRTVVCST